MGRRNQNNNKNHRSNNKGLASKGSGGEQRSRPAATGGAPAKVPDKLVGVISETETGLLRFTPCAKNNYMTFHIDPAKLNGAAIGDVVLVRPDKNGSERTDHPPVSVEKRLGLPTDPGILSLISAHEKGLRTEFNQAAIDETQGMTVPALKSRVDLRQVPLVTIDGADARDFDDAVFAEPTGNGYHLIVAIADVSYYVRPGSELDKEAYQRGNSTYFADRVLPMLPEKLSNELCSLKPHEDRACIAAHLWIDQKGELQKYSFERALMKSHARLTYDQVQAAHEGRTDAMTAPLMKNVINPLFEAYGVLRAARDVRGAMNLEGREYKAVVDRTTGAVQGIEPRPLQDSNKLIEEFMVLANVAAASALEDNKAPCVYRVHERPPSEGKVSDLRTYLNFLGVKAPEGTADHPSFFNEALASAAKGPHLGVVQDSILRVQAKAVYHTDNKGHFGLSLERYAHFTSPIRRYADLLVHRGLVNQFSLGAGGHDGQPVEQLSKAAFHISNTELASQNAERVSNDRFAAEFLSKSKGKKFEGTIQAVGKAGLFVQIDGLGATGVVPLKSLPKDHYQVDEETRSIKGKNHVYRTGAKMEVTVLATDRLKGTILLDPANNNSADLANVGHGKKKKHGYSPD